MTARERTEKRHENPQRDIWIPDDAEDAAQKFGRQKIRSAAGGALGLDDQLDDAAPVKQNDQADAQGGPIHFRHRGNLLATRPCGESDLA